ncbi:MAG: hypothetical protein DYG89_13620 [Caldilinea sp. CFX5]|nr:hypothetical protein [Caldilinea sp. CFX5]
MIDRKKILSYAIQATLTTNVEDSIPWWSMIMFTQRKRLLQITIVGCLCWLLFPSLKPLHVVAAYGGEPHTVGQFPSDQDGDLVPDRQEDRNSDGDLTNDDTDQDGIPDYLDPDDDADATPTAQEDVNQNGDPTDDDRDGDGIPAYLDPVDSAGPAGDSDNDTLPDAQECPQGVCHDSDHDGRADYMDGDDDEDGLPTLAEVSNNAARDDDGDGISNYLDAAETVHAQGATLGDFVWFDLDQDGIQDSSEIHSQAQGRATGVPGLFITLYNADSGAPIATTRSDGDGHYSFANVLAGRYFMEFTTPPGYTFTAADQGDDSFDSDAVRVTASVARSAPITVTPGVDHAAMDVGLWLPQQQSGGLGGQVWYDRNQNGRQEQSEEGMGGIVITLLNQSGSVVATTNSDHSGGYHFLHLPAGVYQLSFTAPTTYAMTVVGQGSGSASENQPMASANARTGPITLAPGAYDGSWRIGLYQANATGLFRGRTWLDQNRNGQQEGAEGGVPGVRVDLLTSTRQWIASTMTDDAGNYRFANLPADNYLLAIHWPAGYAISPQGRGDGARANDFYPASGRTAPLLLLPGAVTVRDSGLYLPAADNSLAAPTTVSGRVWEDQNRNGLQDSQEQPIAAVAVKLYDEQGQVRHSTVTDAQGRYQIANLAPGRYRLAFLSYKGHVPTLADQGINDERDSDVDPPTGRTPLLSLNSGEHGQHWDAGMYFQPKAIALSSFQATFQSGQLVIQWETTSEHETIGYYLAGGTAAEGTDAKMLTREIIAGQGSTGGFYRVTIPYNPVYATPLEQLQLWLIEATADGAETPRGPFGITRTAQFLPLTLR